MMSRAIPFLLLPLLLAGCGDLPEPFQGNPGATARRLSQPPPARLSVPVPDEAMLHGVAAQDWARDVAEALRGQDVPAVAEAPHPDDWQLTMDAEIAGAQITPCFTVRNPAGKKLDTVHGTPVPARDWLLAAPETLHKAAADAAPQIASLLTSIEAARQESDPNSLLNRPARVYVADVRGAPGDGDTALARQMRLDLPKLGEVVQNQAAGADYTVQGLVHMAQGAGNTQRVEIQWIVTDATGREGGRIVQMNEVPPGSLDHYWGDVAVVVAQQAAGGVRNVLTNQLITHQKPGKPAA